MPPERLPLRLFMPPERLPLRLFMPPERLPLRLFMPPQRPLKELVVTNRNLLTFRRVHLKAKAAASSQSRYRHVGAIFGKYSYFIPGYVNIVIVIAYHVIQRTDF
jgi:hypothetical protein